MDLRLDNSSVFSTRQDSLLYAMGISVNLLEPETKCKIRPFLTTSKSSQNIINIQYKTTTF